MSDTQITHTQHRIFILQAFKNEEKDSYDINEAIGLATTLGYSVISKKVIKLRHVTAATFIGKGHVKEIHDYIVNNKIDILFIDAALNPIQLRNLQRILKITTLDRTSIILGIFAMRAKTREGHLQVRLAQLEHQRTQLVRAWTHLERQRGGFGFAAGPGEKQMELDQRMLAQKIASIKANLIKVKRNRDMQRQNRLRNKIPTIALVGYTNAGKSCIFNALTKANLLSEDKLFATLDPTLRRIKLPCREFVVLSDTVGFISNLPTLLVAAFRATLEEIIHADLILHVIDSHNEKAIQQRKEVLKVLHEIGVELRPDRNKEIPIIDIWNKSDLYSPQEKKRLIEQAKRKSNPTYVMSALHNDDCQGLLNLISKTLKKQSKKAAIRISHQRGDIIAWCYENTRVTKNTIYNDYTLLNLEISDRHLGQLHDFALRDKKITISN